MPHQVGTTVSPAWAAAASASSSVKGPKGSSVEHTAPAATAPEAFRNVLRDMFAMPPLYPIRCMVPPGSRRAPKGRFGRASSEKSADLPMPEGLSKPSGKEKTPRAPGRRSQGRKTEASPFRPPAAAGKRRKPCAPAADQRRRNAMASPERVVAAGRPARAKDANRAMRPRRVSPKSRRA